MVETVMGAAPRSVVLFVDDEPAVLDGVRYVLRREEYEILTAQSAEEALELLATQPIGVVVSDECMPRMSGADFLSIVRERYPDVIRIMLTGHASLSAATRAINEGLYRFLPKPMEQEELRRVMRDAIKLRGLNQEHSKLRRNQPT
jgi:two-component system probable response regulator PhcQ